MALAMALGVGLLIVEALGRSEKPSQAVKPPHEHEEVACLDRAHMHGKKTFSARSPTMRSAV